MADRRIDVDEARRKMQAGALLVCAYEDDAKCTALAIQGAIPLSELRARVPTLPKSQEILFLCA